MEEDWEDGLARRTRKRRDGRWRWWGPRNGNEVPDHTS